MLWLRLLPPMKCYFALHFFQHFLDILLWCVLLIPKDCSCFHFPSLQLLASASICQNHWRSSHPTSSFTDQKNWGPRDTVIFPASELGLELKTPDWLFLFQFPLPTALHQHLRPAKQRRRHTLPKSKFHLLYWLSVLSLIENIGPIFLHHVCVLGMVPFYNSQ